MNWTSPPITEPVVRRKERHGIEIHMDDMHLNFLRATTANAGLALHGGAAASRAH